MAEEKRKMWESGTTVDGKNNLFFFQKFNIIAGIIAIIAMPLALILSANPGFWASFHVQIAAYTFFLISYCAWFFTSHKVFGKIVDRNRKKYEIIDYISRICTAVCPLFVILAFFLMGTELGRGENGYYLHLCEWILALSAAAAFSICRYLEICFMLYDIKKRIR